MKELITILGAGESGVGAALLAHDKGYEVLVSDYGTIKPQHKDTLTHEGIQWEEGGHSLERILTSSLVVKSPGIADTTPVMKAILDKNIKVVSEIEFAGRYASTDVKMICITGSNGKTTTTMLTHHILKKGGMDASLAGNIGFSLARQVARDPHKVYVVELSSFQLDNMYDFRADIAMVLNITPDHLDRYDHKMENYTAAKMRVLQNMRPTDSFIYRDDDPVTVEYLKDKAIIPTCYKFGPRRGEGVTAWVEKGVMYVTTPRGSIDMPVDELSLKGVHNLYNSMAAATAALLMGVDGDTVKEALKDFAPVEHRLEPVRQLDGVKYINDSKATNVDSTYYALGAMTTPTVLILGGKDKGNDYEHILQGVKDKVKAIVAMGVDNKKIIDYFKEIVPVKDTHSLEEAVDTCRSLASEGDTVLLSPCCASFDLFKSYEDRGCQFKQYVNSLTPAKK
ncbi:MAG: UDP-N-acetylmuramoyl-L-alanine--D-glutamate ligase [Muribaculaceae bacterium]|nr:UDP-N-acetylmuramoyl-L-alanine--D-glutamate ligase [Muribaculaceae bacterium]